jgi:hypothetical protein
MSFWDIIWFIFITYAFVAYLMVMISIVGDIFRDRETSGVVKATWMVLLVFVPFLTAVVYVITRGSAMGERRMRDAEAAQQRQEAYIREVAAKGAPAVKATPTDQITKARAMFDEGVISQTEFDRLKEKALV